MPATRQIAIVTGAASGLGRAMALGLLGAGIDVAAVDRSAQGLESLTKAAGGNPGTVQTIHADLAQPDAFDRIVAAVLDRHGRIDVLVNNAGIGQASIRADARTTPIRFSTLRRTGVSARTSAGVYDRDEPARDQLGLALLPDPPPLLRPPPLLPDEE